MTTGIYERIAKMKRQKQKLQIRRLKQKVALRKRRRLGGNHGLLLPAIGHAQASQESGRSVRTQTVDGVR